MVRFIFWALMTVVALAPLPFASNRPWSWSLLSLLIGVLLILWAITIFLERKVYRTGRQRRSLIQVRSVRHLPATLIFLGLIVWFAVQASIGTPADWHHPLWREATASLGEPASAAISLDPVRTITSLMRVLAYGGIFWLAMQYGRRTEWANRILWMVCIAGTAYAFYGLVVHLGGYDMILWYEKWAYKTSLTSTFVNRNSYATYAGLGLLVALSLTLKEMDVCAPRGLTSRAGILEFLDNVNLKLFFLVISTVMIAMALLLTQSRGGFLSALVGIFALFISMALNQRKQGRKLIAAVVVTAVAGYLILVVSGGATLTRLAGTGIGDIGDTRHKIYAITLEAVADAPSFGTGLGTFEDVFHKYRGTNWYIWTPAFDQAHNTYLEFALEAGIIPAIIIVALLGGIVLLCLRGVMKRRRNAIFPCIGVAASALVGTHAVIDFSMQIPAVAVTFFLLLGTAYSQSWGTRDRRDGERNLPP